MQQGNGLAACTWARSMHMCLQRRHELAIRTWTCNIDWTYSMDTDMQHGQVHAARPCSCLCSMNMNNEFSPNYGQMRRFCKRLCPCLVHILTACQSMLHVHACSCSSCKYFQRSGNFYFKKEGRGKCSCSGDLHNVDRGGGQHEAQPHSIQKPTNLRVYIYCSIRVVTISMNLAKLTEGLS